VKEASLISQKSQIKKLTEYSTAHEAAARHTLETYASTGASEGVVTTGNSAPWAYASISSALTRRGLVLLAQAQVRSWREGHFDSAIADSYVYLLTSLLIDFSNQRKHGCRPDGSVTPLTSIHTGLCCLALGLTLGTSSARHLADLLVASRMRGEFFGVDEYPLLHSVLAVHEALSGATNFIDSYEQSFQSLPSLKEIVSRLYQRDHDHSLGEDFRRLCDLHATHSRSARRGRNDFVRGIGVMFVLFPVEILGILRLRRDVGLPNPSLDHPLMATPLGALPTRAEAAPDELLQRVLARAFSQGFQPAIPLGDMVHARPPSTGGKEAH
jgi:hypothetical protein